MNHALPLPGTGAANRLALAAVYASALLQGLTLVSFPALSGVLKSALALSDAQYGAIFLPQVACAVAGSLSGGALARRVGLKALLLLALAANAASQLALFASPMLGYGGLLAGTALLGLGFGLGAAPLNSYPPMFFPARRDTALVALHTLMGVGLAAGPVLAGQFALAGGWQGYPLALAGAAAVLAAGCARAMLPAHDGPVSGTAAGHHPARAGAFWLFAAIAVLYAFAEGTFANWAVIYLAESKQLSTMIAAYALSAFWAALAFGRLAISALVLRVAPATIWRVLPAGMIAVFLALPHAQSAAAGIGLFALAGLACSGFFPLTIGLTGSRFPAHVPWVASMLTGALMVGVGLGSWAVGLARQVLTLEQLYLYSAAYPAAVMVLATLLGRRTRGP